MTFRAATLAGCHVLESHAAGTSMEPDEGLDCLTELLGTTGTSRWEFGKYPSKSGGVTLGVAQIHQIL